MELAGARIVIAGATGAVGGALARELAARDAQLALLGRDAPRLEQRAEDLGGVPTAGIDATDLAGCAAAVDAVAAGLGGLDALVVAVGVPAFGDVPDDVAAQLFVTNAQAPIALLRAAARHIEHGGALAAVTAIVAEHPTAGMAAYSASKAALSAWLTATRRERRKQRTTVLDARLPHLDGSDFAAAALHGVPPALRGGLPVGEAAVAIADALAGDRKELSYDLKARTLVAA